MVASAQSLTKLTMDTALAPDRRKALGAFYTDESVVSFLVDWGLEKGSSSVLDPSCGDGRFLEASGTRAGVRLAGCDVSAEALAATRNRLRGLGLAADFLEADFFTVEPTEVPPVDLVLGNPPFIRYQRFDDRSRRAALASALRLGVRLTRLTSTWAPFLLHATRFLNEGGRLAMVVPAEITQTQYGLQTLAALLQRFSAVHLITFEENFFEDAQVETCLLLADGIGGSCDAVRLIPLRSITQLRESTRLLEEAPPIWVHSSGGSLSRFAEAFLSEGERKAWCRARQHPGVRPVAALARVTNGYVTGDNDFFHRTLAAAEKAGYPSTWLFPTARSSRSLLGLRFTRADLVAHDEGGMAHHLVVPQEDLFSEREPLNRFIAEGKARGTPERFKCRKRAPWWRVPGLVEADVLVGYMAGSSPRAAVNEARAFYTNSLHGLRANPEVPVELMALAFYSSLSLLSLEIEGRSYGGGILKVEPRELERVLVPWPSLPPRAIGSLVSSVDSLLRDGKYEEASGKVDSALLCDGLGLSRRTVRQLTAARLRLRNRRLERSRRKS